MALRARRPRSSLFIVLLIGAAALVIVGCAPADRRPLPSGAGIPLPRGVVAEVGVDGDGAFYRFASTLEPAAALAAYAEMLQRSGYTAVGVERGWASYTDGRRTIEARAEPGPPTYVIIRAIAAADHGTATRWVPNPIGPGRRALDSGPASSASPGPGGLAATPTEADGNQTRAANRPDPPHGSTAGLGSGAGSAGAGGDNPGKADGSGKGKGSGAATSSGGKGGGKGNGKGNGKAKEKAKETAKETKKDKDSAGAAPSPRPTKSPKP